MNLSLSAGDISDKGSIPGPERPPGGGHGNPLQYSCLENPMDRGAWQATVHGVTELDTTEPLNIACQLYFNKIGRKNISEKEMATHSSILAWKIPWTEDPSGLQSVGSHKELVTTEWLTLSLSHKRTEFFFLDFLKIWTIFKIFIEFVTILFLFYGLVFFWPRGMWDLSSLTRDQTYTPCIGRWSLIIGTPKKSRGPRFKKGAER